ncbi:uncharacterized protein LOC120346680 [Styela clava]
MLAYSFTSALIICLLHSCEGIVSCPEPNEDCDCQNLNEAGGYVKCVGVSNIPNNLPEETGILDLGGSTIGSVLLGDKMDNLNNLTLTQLYLNDAGLLAIEDRAFMNLGSLRKLDLSNNNFRSLNDQTFFGLAELETLFLSKSFIFEISPAVFVYTPSLVYLDLDKNMLTEITDQFSSLTNLESLLIASNKITKIAEDAFSYQDRLKRLDLYNNQLTAPNKGWFEILVVNNGELIISEPDFSENPWRCCGEKAINYRQFVKALPNDLNSRNEYNIVCSWPEKYKNHSIGDITEDGLKATSCDNQNDDASNSEMAVESILSATTVVSPTIASQTVNSETVNDMNTVNETSGLRFEISPSGGNFFNHLTDAHIVLILLAVVVIVVILTTIVVHKYHIRQHGKAFAEFVNNLPNSRGGDSDDDIGLTTRTYRQDAPVYGSTGQVVDRHKGGSMVSSSSVSSDDTSSEELSGVVKPEKRKPPPYDPPTESPDDLDLGSGGIYSSTQFNNSSSVGMNFNLEWEQDRRSQTEKTNAFSFSNLEYDSDQSDDLWNITTVKEC